MTVNSQAYKDEILFHIETAGAFSGRRQRQTGLLEMLVLEEPEVRAAWQRGFQRGLRGE